MNIFFYRRVIKIRIFIAIDFDKSTKYYLQDIKNKLENYCIKGQFINIENFHLTLQFIGEQEVNIPKVLNAMHKCVSKHNTFSLTLHKLGSFKKGDFNILWIGLNYSDKLVEIYRELCLALKQARIAFDEKPLKPHITLGRQIILKNGISELIILLPINKVIIPVNNITLMESKQVNGILTYIPLATFPLRH